MKNLILLSLLFISVSAFGQQKTDAELTTQSNVIRNESTPGANTKGRVADMYQAIIDSKLNKLNNLSEVNPPIARGNLGLGTLATQNGTSPLGAIVGTTDIQTITNKTLTAPIINFGGDVNGDIIIRSSSLYGRLGIGTTGQVLTVSGGLPIWQTPFVSPLTTTGDIIYGVGSSPTRLAGNISLTKKFLSQTGNGTISAAPSWSILNASDIPDISSTYQPLISGTGYIKFAGLSTSFVTSIPNADLLNSDITINGVHVSLGGSTTVTAAAPNPLTIGTGLQFNSGTTYDGSVAKTISIDNTVATLTGTQVLTNKDLTSGTNTFPTFNQNTTGSSGSVANALTVDNSSIQLNTGTTYDGGAARIISVKNFGITNAMLEGNIDLTSKVTGLLPDGNISSASTWNAKQSAITFGTGAQTALGVNVGTAGSFVVNGGAGGTPSSMTGTNITGTAAGLTAGNVTTNANLTGPITSSGNATSVASQTGTGTTFVMSASPTLTGTVGVPTNSPSSGGAIAASQAYVDNAILGQRTKEATKYASTAALPSIVYSNGSSGVGATLTGVALAAISLDGNSPSVADRVLIKNQASTFQNGIYTVTQTGSGIAVFILTRATDFDQAADIQTGDNVFVTSGSTLGTTTWTYNAGDNPVMGTDAITFVQIAGQGSFTGGNGITITGTSIAVDLSIVVDKTTSQTLTNKTLTNAVVGTQSANDNSTKAASTAYVDSKLETWPIAGSDEVTILSPASTSVPIVTFYMPYAFTVTRVFASLTTAGTGASNCIVDIHEDGTTIMSTTKILFSASATKSANGTLSDSSLAADSKIELFLDQRDTNNVATGLKIYIVGHQ